MIGKDEAIRLKKMRKEPEMAFPDLSEKERGYWQTQAALLGGNEGEDDAEEGDG